MSFIGITSWPKKKKKKKAGIQSCMRKTAVKLIKSNHADSATEVRKQKHTLPSLSLSLSLSPSLNPSCIPYYHSLTPHPYGLHLPLSDKVRFSESFWSYANCMTVWYPDLCRPMSMLSLHYSTKRLLNIKLWQCNFIIFRVKKRIKCITKFTSIGVFTAKIYWWKSRTAT